MLTHEIRNQLLVDELQLGNRLNQDIQTSDHADFALLLAMLSHDVTDNPEFSSSESKLKEDDLRKKFNLLPEQKKYAETQKTPHKRALVLTARKVVRLLYSLLKNNRLYARTI